MRSRSVTKLMVCFSEICLTFFTAWWNHKLSSQILGWPGGSRRPANYTTKSYVDQWTEYADAIGKDALGADDAELQPLFQGCAFTAPRNIDPGNNSVWNVESVLQLGMAESGRLKTVADHDVSLD